METTEAFDGLCCTDCGTTHSERTSHRCPDCGGLLDAAYEHVATAADLSGHGLRRYAPLLPVPRESFVTAETGGTPLVDCPDLATQLGVASVALKDEGRNATGSVADRGLALAVTVAAHHGATDVALPTTGNSGQAAAAHAARAGLDSHSFVPSRTPFVNKAMINVHGGDMSVVEGRYSDAAGAFADAVADEEWYSVAAFASPYRHEGTKTLAYELAEERDWTPPDAVVHPTGHGTGVVGLQKGFRDLRKLDLIADTPRIYAAQASGSAPIADAWERDARTVEAWEHPDTICGPLEIPDPVGGQRIIEALAASDGAAVATDDESILEAATSLAAAGVPASVTGGAAVSGAQALADRGAFAPDDDVVLIDPTSGNKEADVLRSHLMRQGI
jgi:threonine synthase